MSTAHLYNIKGARGSYDASINGFDFVVKATLTGIVAGGPEPEVDTDIKQIYEALTDSAIPLAGDDLFLATGIADLKGCWLRKIDADAIGDGEFALTLTYQQSQFGITQIDVGSQLSQIETTNYQAGPLAPGSIVTLYEYDSDYGGTDPSSEQLRLRGTGLLEQGGTVTVFKPEGSRIYTVREGVDPAIPQSLYEGKVNDKLWWFKEAGEWLCTSITGTSDNSGTLVTMPTMWVNRYEFQYRIGGWDPEVVYSDDLTGEPVPDPIQDVGKITVESYESFDFTELFSTPLIIPVV
jgi:hypothetical protein